MDVEEMRLTPEEARERLQTSRDSSLPSRRDRQVHATGTAVFGLTTGLYMAAQNVVVGIGSILLTCVALAIFIAEAIWVERAARTVPRRARLWSRVGVGMSFALALFVVLPWLNLSARSEPNTWPMVLAGASVAGLPSLIAAVGIARGRDER